MRKKMRLRNLLFAVSLLSFSGITAQAPLLICSGSTPLIDGTVSPGEWNDANHSTILLPNDSVVVHYKHNGDSLFLLYYGPLESSNVLFPEVLIDIYNNKAATWDSTDWWFHVSATDCYFNGQYGNYSGTCMPDHPAWSGFPNFAAGPPYTDTVEIAIPFSTTGISTGDTIGLAFDVTNTASNWKYWPSGASRNNPSTWGTAVISNCIGIGQQELNAASSWHIYPNPATTAFNAELRSNEPATLRLYTITGQQCLQQEIAAGDAATAVSVASFAPGIYFAELRQGNAISRKKIVLQ